jgi:hypothetical protein
MKSQFGKCENGVISPRHKQTEGRAPVWGSKFTTKVATIQEGFSRTAPTLNVKLWVLVVVVVVARSQLSGTTEPDPLLNIF